MGEWKVGDVVRFNHEPAETRRKVTAVVEGPQGPMLEVEGMVGQFAPHVFVCIESAT